MPKWIEIGRVVSVNDNPLTNHTRAITVKFCLIDGFKPYYTTANVYLEVEFKHHIMRIYNPDGLRFKVSELVKVLARMMQQEPIRYQVMGENK